MKKQKYFSVLFILPFFLSLAGAEEISYLSEDQVQIHATIYKKSSQKLSGRFFLNNEEIILLLFHQQGWNKEEFSGIVEKLTSMGFTVATVDLRFGGTFRGENNPTAGDANKKGKKIDYLSTLYDIRASIKEFSKKYPKSSLILWGSSVSASLVMIEASKDYKNKKIVAVMAFSPGEYFVTSHYLANNVKNLAHPIFMTCSREELDSVMPLYQKIPSSQKVFFTPKGSGQHGSKALWAEYTSHDEYWEAVENFFIYLYYKI